jgi:tRNA threonylcarbamoyl adenosine modification protein YeaZ
VGELMLGLVLEVSTERGIVAAFDHDNCLFQEQLPYGIQNSHFLLPELQKKINDRFKLANLSYIAVGVGPGSYTGIRVGAAIAKTLAFVFQIPLIGICTLDTFVPDEEGVFAVVIDAKIGGAYLQIGCLKNGRVEPVRGPQACSLAEAAELLENIPTIVTPNAGQIRTKLEKIKPENHWNWQESYPRAERLLLIAQNKMKEGAFSTDCQLELLYMRKTQAEIERDLS